MYSRPARTRGRREFQAGRGSRGRLQLGQLWAPRRHDLTAESGQEQTLSYGIRPRVHSLSTGAGVAVLGVLRFDASKRDSSRCAELADRLLARACGRVAGARRTNRLRNRDEA